MKQIETLDQGHGEQQIIAELRELAQEWKIQSARSRKSDHSFWEAAASRERCAKELLDKLFELEGR